MNFAATDHFRGIIAMEEIGLSPPNFWIGRILSPLSSVNMVDNAILMPSSVEVPWMTLASVESTVLIVGFFSCEGGMFLLSLACFRWL